MAAVMVERDAVMAAVGGLMGEALEGRGGALFVVGEAGLGKTTVLEHAVTAARDRFKVGIGRADVAEAALPFGLISQALEALLGGSAVPADSAERSAAPAPADYFYAVLTRLRRAAAEPLFLALDDAHWADPDSLTLLRLICRRVAALPVAVLVTARPWPPEAMRAGEELAAQQLAVVQQPGPAQPSGGAVHPQPAGRYARFGDRGTGTRRRLSAPGTRCCWTWWPQRCGLARVSRSRIHRPARRGRAGCCCLTWPAWTSRCNGTCGPPRCWGGVSAPRWRPRSPGWRPRMRQRRKKRSPPPGWAATPARAGPNSATSSSARPSTSWPPPSGRSCTRQHSGPWLPAGINPAEAAGHAVAARLAGDPQALDVLAHAGRGALQAGAVGAARRHLQAAVDLAGPAAPADLVFDLGRALIAGGDHVAGVARYEELLARADLPGDTRLAILGQLSQAWLYAGRIAEAEAAMEEAQLLAGPDRRDLAAGAMVDHAAQVMVTYGWKRAEPLAVRARELAAEASAPVRAAAAAVWAVGTYFSGDPAGLDVAEAAARSAATTPRWRPTGTPWWDPVAQYASLALSAERFGEAQRLLDNILEAAERRSDPMAVAMALLYRGRLRWRLGQLDDALAAVRAPARGGRSGAGTDSGCGS